MLKQILVSSSVVFVKQYPYLLSEKTQSFTTLYIQFSSATCFGCFLYEIYMEKNAEVEAFPSLRSCALSDNECRQWQETFRL